jgi:hypothetical protein
MIKGVYKFVGFGIVFLIFLMMVMSTLESHPNNKELEQPVLEIRKDFSNQIKIERDSDIPCQNLDVLDSVKEILHWEMINDTLHVYTKEDSIRDELERWRYIDSIYKADERAYDKWMESQ